MLKKLGEAALVGLTSTPILDGPAYFSSFNAANTNNNKISQHESQVLQLLVEGNCTKEVASLLNPSNSSGGRG